ncbi:MAG: hypothetical protein AB7I36_00090 [Rhodospirillaceae bacterium]
MAKIVGVSASIGFLLSVLMLVGVAWYATVLRTALAECRAAHVAANKALLKSENHRGSLREELANAAREIDGEHRKIIALESRLEAAGALRRCVSRDGALRG